MTFISLIVELGWSEIKTDLYGRKERAKRLRPFLGSSGVESPCLPHMSDDIELWELDLANNPASSILSYKVA